MAHDERLLSVFVDESGNFGDPDDPARYCIVTLVLHDQSVDISRFVSELDRANYDLGLDPDMFRFHTAPPMHLAEKRFFGGPRDFKRNFLKKITAKELR